MVAADVDTLVEAPAASVVEAEMVVAVDTALASASETLTACVWKVGESVAWLVFPPGGRPVFLPVEVLAVGTSQVQIAWRRSKAHHMRRWVDSASLAPASLVSS